MGGGVGGSGSGGSGSGGGGGGGAAGQAPYRPGENDRLPWEELGDLNGALNREEGGARPILVLVVSSEFSKDCCAANFERAIFRDKDCVELAKSFLCVRYNAVVGAEANWVERFSVNTKKPAILLLDAEAGLLHKQQLCANPNDYEKAMKDALAANEMRVKLRPKFLAERAEARRALDEKDFAKAAKALAKLCERKTQMSGSVLERVEKDLAELEGAAKTSFAAASEARDGARLLDAYKQFRSLEKDFAVLDAIESDAKREADALVPRLKGLGIPL